MIETYYRHCEGTEIEYVVDVGAVITDPGPCTTDYPHAGILNTTAFLTRYPTTATNRNRARSRWTHYHFLGTDIEQSAPRTTDPDALADTNNPTLYNPNCTVCHTVMDPVAGTFQNWDERGFYKSAYGGIDSLDFFYKYRPDGTEHNVTIDASAQVPHVIMADGFLSAGSREIGFQTVNSRDVGHTNLHVDYLTLTNELGDVVQHIELEDVSTRNWDGVSADICCETLVVPVDIPADGTYRVEVAAWVGWQNDEAEGRDGTLLISIGGPFYQEGDTWYRDMRDPGFDGDLARTPMRAPFGLRNRRSPMRASRKPPSSSGGRRSWAKKSPVRRPKAMRTSMAGWSNRIRRPPWSRRSGKGSATVLPAAPPTTSKTCSSKSS